MASNHDQSKMVQWLTTLHLKDTDAVQMATLLNQGGFDTVESLLHLPTAYLTPQSLSHRYPEHPAKEWEKVWNGANNTEAIQNFLNSETRTDFVNGWNRIKEVTVEG